MFCCHSIKLLAVKELKGQLRAMCSPQLQRQSHLIDYQAALNDLSRIMGAVEKAFVNQADQGDIALLQNAPHVKVKLL